jgi:hypothetical protein
MFPSLAKWGADVVPNAPPLKAAPVFDQPHDRSSWVHYKMGDYPAIQLSIDDVAVVPFYSWLAKTFTFCDHHFCTATNSTAGHLLAFTGQTPTFKNPPFTGAHPVWDIPTVFALAERSGVSWGAFADQDQYPVKFIAELTQPAVAAKIHGPGEFLRMAQADELPRLSYVWSPRGFDEHPPFAKVKDPAYQTKGHDLIWQEVDAVVKAGGWSDTTFILTYDDWGGYADHVDVPNIETLPDALHPDGFQAIGGSRVPLIMFGAKVKQGIDNQWHSHASIIKTAIDMFRLPRLGVPRVDTARSLVGRLDASLQRPPPPSSALGSLSRNRRHRRPNRNARVRGPGHLPSRCHHSWSTPGRPCRRRPTGSSSPNRRKPPPRLPASTSTRRSRRRRGRVQVRLVHGAVIRGCSGISRRYPSM